MERKSVFARLFEGLGVIMFIPTFVHFIFYRDSREILIGWFLLIICCLMVSKVWDNVWSSIFGVRAEEDTKEQTDE